MARPLNTPEICPHCGADVPPKARACPECGSDEKTGWSDDAAADRLGISPELDYDEFVQREFNPDQSVKPRGISWLWWLVAVILLATFALVYLNVL